LLPAAAVGLAAIWWILELAQPEADRTPPELRFPTSVDSSRPVQSGGSPLSTLEAGARHASTPGTIQFPAAVASEPSATGAWTLRVRILQGDRPSQDAGRLECLYGPFQLERRPRESTGTLQAGISAGEARLWLPPSVQEALLTARTARGAWGRLRLDFERFNATGPPRELEISIELERESPRPSLRGSIRIEGRDGLPDGLLVELVRAGNSDEPEDPTSVGSVEHVVQVPRTVPDRLDPRQVSPGAVTAFVDTLQSTYEVGPLRPGRWGVLVTAPEFPPHWFPLPRRASQPADQVMDLVCRPGTTLRLALERPDGTPTRNGASLICRGQSLTWQRGETRTIRPWERRTVVGRDGRAEFRGLPEGTLATVAMLGGAGDHTDILVADLTEARQGLLERRVVLAAHEACVAWGPTPMPASLGRTGLDGLRVLARPAGVRGVSSTVSSPLLPEDQDWRLTLPSHHATWQLWLDDAGTRESDLLAVDALVSPAAGPLTFVQIQTADTTVRWVDAPIGWTLSMFVGDGRTSPLGPLRRVQLQAAEGQITGLPASATTRLSVFVERGDLARVYRRYEPGVFDPVLFLAGSSEATLEFRVNGHAPPGQGYLTLCLLDDCPGRVDKLGARVLLRGGVAALPLPVPAGRYYYRYDSDRMAGLLCGIATLSAGVAAAQVVEWSGRRSNLDDLLDAYGAAALQVMACKGEDVQQRVDLEHRRFDLQRLRFQALESGEPDCEILIDEHGTSLATTRPFP
jgi:hypothetical protein